MKTSNIFDKKMKIAFRIAQIHLKKFEKHNRSINRLVGSITPLFEPDSKEPTIYDVALQNEKGKQDGYLLVSLTRKYPPVIKFSFTGKSDYHHLKEKIEKPEFFPIIYTPFFIIAETKDGEYIDYYGDLETFPNDIKKMGKKFDYTKFKTCYIKHKEKKRIKMEKSVLKKWNAITKKTAGDISDVQYIDPANVPNYDFQVLTAYHSEYLARYTQIDPYTGANSAHDFYSGCTACAWMCLIGYHDNVYTLDLLRGTHYDRGTDNSYPSRVTVKLSEHLGTHKAKNGNGGSCDPRNIKNGYGFIENKMGFSIKNKMYREDDGIPALQVVYDALRLWGVPSVISIPGHSLIAYEILADFYDDRGDHYLKVYQGWGTDDPYISYDLIDDGAWAFERINTNNEVNTNIRSLATPVTLELGDSQHSTELVIATRLENENIGIIYSSDGKHFQLRYEIEATGTTPPSMAVEDGRYDPYVAWSEDDGELKLVQIYPKGESFIELIAPYDRATGNIGPVIQVLDRKLFYIWDLYITYTDVQNLERSGRPWPTEVGYNSYNNSYLSSLSLINPYETPCLIKVQNKLYYSYKKSRLPYDQGMLIFKIANDGNIEFYRDNTGKMEYPGEKRLLYYNNTLYGTNYGSISEISTSTYNLTKETKYFPYGISTSYVNIGVFSNYAIGPCVFSIYLKNNYIYIRYHSIDTPANPIDYTGYPNF